MTKEMLGSLVAVVVAMATAGVSCDDFDTNTGAAVPGALSRSPGAAGGGTSSAQPPAGETAPTFTPPEITNIATAINLGEIARAQVALQRASNPEVRAYAEAMLSEHTRANERLRAISVDQGGTGGAQASITLDPTARALQRHDLLIVQDLQGQSGVDFDLAYITSQMAAHGKVLAMIDRALLPSVIAAGQANTVAGLPPTGLINELQIEREAVARHFVQALQMQQRVRQAADGQLTAPVSR